jgi:alpha-mannosidase
MGDIATYDRLLEALRERIFTPLVAPIPLRFRRAGNDERATVVTEPRNGWALVDRDLVWGEPDGYFWFEGTAIIPPVAAGRRVYCRIDAQFGSVMGRSDPQCLVRIDGRIVQGGDGNHREFLLTKEATAGERFDILIEAGTIEDRRQLGFALTLLVHDPLAEKLYYDLKVPLDVARLLKPDDARRTRILRHIGDALSTIDLRPGDDERFARSLRAAEAFADDIYGDADADAMPTIVATGHTHIDVAWLWRVRETRQKMARSFATALSLMDEYPDYRFMYNQGLLLDYLSEDYPELFERTKQRIADGQFEIEGALWLEPDATITGGESMVRHILHGIRYHQRNFGVTPRILWLPDTFGYSAALPQLMAQSGLDMFVTHKLSWNDTNRMPNEVFHWQGIDGTAVPAYFLTTQKYEYDGINTTYCPDLVPSHVMGAWKRFSQKGTLDELFLVYGHGDGGGGPTRAMLENVRRMERGIPGCPRLVHDKMGPFFSRISERFRTEPDAFPTWVGELYLEYHRGTLTSMASTKRANRLAEVSLRELETLAVLAMQQGTPYPAYELWALWQIVLLNQFHDILPGSSIGAVYADAERDYAEFDRLATALRTRLAGALAGAGQHLLFNVLPRERVELVRLPAGMCSLVDQHTAIPAQELVHADGSVSYAATAASVPAMGGRTVELSAEPRSFPGDDSQLSVSPTHLENANIRLDLDDRGGIVSLVDKVTGRQAVAAGKSANALFAHRDMPVAFDAWDIDASFDDVVWPIDQLVSSEVVEHGPLRAAVRLEWRYESSRIVQILSLEADARQVEIESFIDWHEHHTLLKAAFPLAIRTDSIAAEIQFGHVVRPTHQNTSWDTARFEASMQRWVDVSEPGFGVALLNDCKHGYDAKGSVVRLSLLRSPTYPWPAADQGVHRFRYAILLHDGDRGHVHDRAEAFNNLLRLLPGSSGPSGSALSFARIDGEGVSVESAKKAEDSDAVVLRLWETRGGRRQVAVELNGNYRVVESDLLERPVRVLAEGASRIALEFTPFEIKTLLLEKV